MKEKENMDSGPCPSLAVPGVLDEPHKMVPHIPSGTELGSDDKPVASQEEAALRLGKEGCCGRARMSLPSTGSGWDRAVVLGQTQG